MFLIFWLILLIQFFISSFERVPRSIQIWRTQVSLKFLLTKFHVTQTDWPNWALPKYWALFSKTTWTPFDETIQLANTIHFVDTFGQQKNNWTWILLQNNSYEKEMIEFEPARIFLSLTATALFPMKTMLKLGSHEWFTLAMVGKIPPPKGVVSRNSPWPKSSAFFQILDSDNYKSRYPAKIETQNRLWQPDFGVSVVEFTGSFSFDIYHFSSYW